MMVVMKTNKQKYHCLHSNFIVRFCLTLGVALDNNLTNSETVALCLVALDMGRSPRLSASFIHTKEVMMMQASTSKYTNTNTRWQKQSLLYWIFITFTKIGITMRSTNDDNVTRVIFMLFLTFIFFAVKAWLTILKVCDCNNLYFYVVWRVFARTSLLSPSHPWEKQPEHLNASFIHLSLS